MSHGVTGRKQGEQVSFSYAADSANAAANPLTLYDSNGVARPLLLHERLILDVVSFDTEFSDTTNLVYLVAAPAATAPSDPGSGNTPTQPTYAQFTAGGQLPGQGCVFPAEGLSLPAFTIPYILLPGNGWASSAVAGSGTGRIITAGTYRHQPYQAVLTPGGSIYGQ